MQGLKDSRLDYSAGGEGWGWLSRLPGELSRSSLGMARGGANPHPLTYNTATSLPSNSTLIYFIKLYVFYLNNL